MMLKHWSSRKYLMHIGCNISKLITSRTGAHVLFSTIIKSLAQENGDQYKSLGYSSNLTLDFVLDLAKKTLDLLYLCVDRIPYGVRWIFKQMRSFLRVI